jgi:hypothetical protein
MSEPDANTCTRISSHGSKRRLHAQTTTKGFKTFHQLSMSKRGKFDPQLGEI